MERISTVLVLTGLLFLSVILSAVFYLRARQLGRKLHLVESSYGILQSQKDEAILSIKDYYHSLLDQIPAGIILVGKAGKITYSNAAAERLLSTNKKGLKRVPLSRFAANFELAQKLNQALEGKEVEREIRISRPQDRILKARMSPIREDGAVQGAVVVLEDVTRLRQLEKSRQEFVSSFSHELRTPIASCQASLEALLELKADRSPEEREKFLRNLSQQMEHLSSLVTRMLQLARLESGTSIVSRIKIGAAQSVEKAIRTVEMLAQAKEVRLEKDVPPGLYVKADPELFTQALINLLDNAIKYTKQGGRVSIEVKESDSRVIFAVADTGKGIPEEAQPHVFERFYRVDKHRSREKGGTGLGLALTKHIVQAHRGKIKVESTPHEGSTFSISLRKA